MNVTRRVGQFATVIVLVLAAASRVATAENFVCNPITRGDTATGLALRLTGNMAIAYTDWLIQESRASPVRTQVAVTSD